MQHTITMINEQQRLQEQEKHSYYRKRMYPVTKSDSLWRHKDILADKKTHNNCGAHQSCVSCYKTRVQTSAQPDDANSKHVDPEIRDFFLHPDIIYGKLFQEGSSVCVDDFRNVYN